MILKIEQILEYTTIFPEKDYASYQVDLVLKKYSREMLIRAVNVLSMNYGNAYMPDSQKTFFSSVIRPQLFENIDSRICKYLQNTHRKKVCFCTQRTILELLRRIFEIPPTDFKNNGTPDVFEYDLFCILVYLNEALMKFKSYNEYDPDKFQALIYLSNYVHNDLTNIDYKRVLLTQILYFNYLRLFLNNCQDAISLRNKVLNNLRISDLDEFMYTITCLVALYVNEKSTSNGCPMLNLDKIKAARLNKDICEFLSIGMDDTYPYVISNDKDYNRRDNNLDYRVFRSHPLIKMDDGCYIIYSLPILCERLYNGFVFDLSNAYTGKDFFSFYNKQFVEHYLFHNIILNCIGKHTSCTYPTIAEINSGNYKKEQHHQPDFYIREKYKLVIFECKSIKLHSIIRENADVDELIGILQNKLEESIQNIDKSRHVKDKSELVGISQLINYIVRIEDDIFPFDNTIPDDVAYYPVLVLDDPLIIQLGLTNLLNQWYYKRIKKQIPEAMCHPLVVTSIDMFALYSNIFRKQGFTAVFDKFFSENVNYTKDGFVDTISPVMDFSVFLHTHYHPNKTAINNMVSHLNEVAKSYIYKS